VSWQRNKNNSTTESSTLYFFIEGYKLTDWISFYF
jgi:hypothetical protein